MIKYLNLLPWLVAASVVAQDELPDLRVQNPGGTVQELFEVKLLRVEPDGVRVLHSAGAAKVPYELLPEDLQVKYGFNAAQAQEHRDAAAAAATAIHPSAGAPSALPQSGIAAGSSGWTAAASSAGTTGSTWTDTAAWVTNNTPSTNNSNSPTNSSTSTTNRSNSTTRRSSSFASNSSGYGRGLSSYGRRSSEGSRCSNGYESNSGDYAYRSSASLGGFGTPVVARVNSRRSSGSSTRYYGSTYNCSSYRSPTYYTSRPTIITIGPTASASVQNFTSGHIRR